MGMSTQEVAAHSSSHFSWTNRAATQSIMLLVLAHKLKDGLQLRCAVKAS